MKGGPSTTRGLLSIGALHRPSAENEIIKLQRLVPEVSVDDKGLLGKARKRRLQAQIARSAIYLLGEAPGCLWAMAGCLARSP